MPRLLTVREEVFPIRGTFRISRGARTEARILVCEIADGDVVGRGECTPYARYGETVDEVARAIAAIGPAIAGGLEREGLQRAMRPGAARNAVDCALWDLEAKQAGRRVWELAGLPEPEPVTTAFTLSVDTPEAMGRAAAEAADRPLLKLKLTGDEEDADRVAAVRANAPKARIIVDANEALTLEAAVALAPALAEAGVELLEQPLHAEADEALRGVPFPLPLGADESCHDTATLPRLVGLYQVINIKLDKTGGLTEALRLRAAAEAAGLRVMVGCMLASSLAMAPAHLVAQGAAFVDIDGPLLLARDRSPGLRYERSLVHPPEPGLWG
ncbi:dipeptide epimerase [Elioraea tepida]|uniref:Dipeptide epimerase n=1 Tax=Elioraea tepida TaxID=2843330 RepID=A0A975U2V6_9PROT|nr:N-acetyl-D-Glu racemase DgcA [Elioraea tepida]QXM25411.1 dipeptide epimerase [Elioraea tepida]